MKPFCTPLRTMVFGTKPAWYIWAFDDLAQRSYYKIVHSPKAISLFPYMVRR